MPFRKNVFIVGAGFSAESGAPVIRNFYERAMELWRDPSSPLSPDERLRFQGVHEFRHNLALAEHKIRIDLDNIEDLFGVVEMGSHLDAENAESIRSHLVYVILRTLELTATEHPAGCVVRVDKPGSGDVGFGPGDIYQFFVSAVARRWSKAPSDGVAKDTIISLNYDSLIEQAMEGSPLAADYCLPSEKTIEHPQHRPIISKVRVLKLHGSANWTVCPQCKSRVYVITPPAYRSPVKEPDCPECKVAMALPLIVPPTWSKEEFRPLLRSVWHTALLELASAERLFIVGYSMPETDKFFQYLLALSLQGNTLLDEIVIVNSNPQDAEKIATLFPRWNERGKVHRPGGFFAGWVRNGYFQSALGQRYSSADLTW